MAKFNGLICAAMLMLTGSLSAQDKDWNYISAKDIISKDSTVNKGYTLIFINESPTFDTAIQRKLTNAFFTVYPKEAKTYNKHTLKKVTFIIDPNYTGVAATAGGIVRFNPVWFAKHPGDIDVVTHEVMHIVQGYPDGAPGWLVEGVADYVRYKFGVDNAGAGWSLTPFNEKQHYDNAYRITARFLVWVEQHYSKKLVKQMDAAMRKQQYQPELWNKITGKSVDELWTEYSKDPVIS